MLCVAVTPAELEDILQSDIHQADCVEVRLDYLKNPQLSRDFNWSHLNIPVIATCRRVERGGRFKGTIQDEHAILESAVRNGAAFVDIDYRDIREIPGAKVIGSFHDFEQTPPDILQHLQKACSHSAVQIAKVASTVRSWADNKRLLDLLARPWPKPVIVAGMGEMGQLTRVIGPSRGSHLTYATTAQPSGQPSAPGQITAQDLLQHYRYRRIGPNTKLFGVVGNPVSHSRGYQLHNRAFETAAVDFAYMKFPVTDVNDFFANALDIGIRGFSVTMPHKTAVIPFLSGMSAAAQKVGAVNTVVHSDQGWIGDNTDVHGVLAALASVDFNPAGKRVVILGTGGAAKAAVAAVEEASHVTTLPRSEVKNGGSYPCDLLINATPVGMRPNVNDTPVSGAIQADVVFDMVYTPPATQLLKSAQQQGKRVISGTVMFFAQAARQFEIWTGKSAPAGIYAPEPFV